MDGLVRKLCDGKTEMGINYYKILQNILVYWLTTLTKDSRHTGIQATLEVFLELIAVETAV